MGNRERREGGHSGRVKKRGGGRLTQQYVFQVVPKSIRFIPALFKALSRRRASLSNVTFSPFRFMIHDRVVDNAMSNCNSHVALYSLS